MNNIFLLITSYKFFILYIPFSNKCKEKILINFIVYLNVNKKEIYFFNFNFNFNLTFSYMFSLAQNSVLSNLQINSTLPISL